MRCWGAPPSISPQLLSTYRRFWFFNVTNQQKFLDGNEPLHLVEIGPYVFREVVEKNVTGTFENGTVEYYEKKTFFFVKEESVGDQSELMTTINAPILVSPSYDIFEKRKT
ncbi:unnamed protein product [Darwinula stevensoni]|uniref:Scavenger receptor class B member 1 n=1 Tax=Darwinula stevensoni TaxID=69355 RepID=A0A7R9A5L7_9CRUS|nr:unnamed protein product [Darwinula stevensoni]CAG0895805.1 unnamed protein product [Darwinula stevensoni]